jgi:hypothetical protein
MSLLSGRLLGSRQPAYRTGPRARSGLGEEAVDLADLAGLELDDWQADVLEHTLRTQSDGRWAAFEVGLVVPRQNGKGSVLEARELHGLFCEPDTRLILHSAHEFKTAKEAFRRIVTLIDRSPRLKKQVDHVRYTTGEEGVELKDGSRLKFVARSSGSGRGFSGDLVILDEAYNLSQEMMSALLPTMSARPNPQLWYTSSAPLPASVSDVLRRLCRRGREGSAGLAYAEWCAPHDPKRVDLVDLDDRENWAAGNPGLGLRLSEEFTELERKALQPEDFARERLGVWPDIDASDLWAVIGRAQWERCLADESTRPAVPAAIAFDIPPDRSSGSIGCAAPFQDGVWVDVLDHGPGTGWMLDRLVTLKQRYPRAVFCCDASGPAGSLLDPLRKAGVKRVKALSTQDHKQACGDFFDAVVGSPASTGRAEVPPSVRHAGRAELDEAVAGATKRRVGDAWLWDRRNSGVDISPLVAVTLAFREGRQRRSLNLDNYRKGGTG